MLETANLLTLLKGRLLQGHRIRLHHISTAPASCPALFAPGPGASEAATTIESHFLVISQPCNPSTDPKNPISDVAVLGIEVLIFTANDLTTIFVSKADSTGLLVRSVSPAARQTSVAQVIITAFLESLMSRCLDRNRVVLSLFARSQNQYLFPGSIENVSKHVLDDRQLIKWWCRILDPLARKVANSGLQHVNAHVVVPGCDTGETKAFFPPSALSDSVSQPLWRNAYPVDLLNGNTSLPVRCLVPRLPDDPKSRFLDDLDAQCDAKGNWRGVRTLDQFWELMSYRQECSAGRLVGFVWVVFSPAKALSTTPKTEMASMTSANSDTRGVKNEQISMQKQKDEEQREEQTEREQHPAQSMTKQNVSSVTTLPSADEAEEILTHDTLLSRVKANDQRQERTQLTLSMPSDNAKPMENDSVVDDLTIRQPVVKQADAVKTISAEPPGGIIVSAEHYQILMDEMLQLDFAGEDTAIESTTKWRNKVIELSGISQFGIEIEGAAEVDSHTTTAATAAGPSEVGSKSTQSVNILTGVRKKRKVESNGTVIAEGTKETTAVNNLATNLVRKKPKT